jgi:acetyl esterase/lipase
VPFVLLVLALFWALFAAVALWGERLWLPAMVGAELGTWLAAAGLLVLGLGSLLGWVSGMLGIGAVLGFVAAAAGFVVAGASAAAAPGAAATAVAQFIGEPVRPPAWARIGFAVPIAVRPRRLVIDAGKRYGPHPRHRLDHLRIPGPGPRPAIVYVHGGGWWRGRRDTQARHLLYRLAASGWHVFAPSYRLSPEVTPPEHLIDIKRTIAWIRLNAEAFDIDPGFIAVAGGSTGGNLAALAALTDGRTDLQPGFEDVDTSVQACIPFYGVHDLLDGHGRPLWPYLVDVVMQSDPATDPAAWDESSPTQMVHADRPPFFVVHGDGDGLVPVDQSRSLVEALRDEGGAAVGYLEVPGANHGFDFFAGVRGRSAAAAVDRVLAHLHDGHRVR